ncbi:hypothetical protein [Pseudomonas sp. RC10]|uniref:hypothetical protein n=1 Tax=Pseudomonas bambusae TaxID=3139142 RepID=UPI003139E51D
MLPHNTSIALTEDSALSVLKEIEYMLISLKNIARHYYDNADDPKDVDPIAYAIETTRFIDENDIVYKLANMREVISDAFDDERGDDDMDDIERAMEHLVFWEKPGD